MLGASLAGRTPGTAGRDTVQIDMDMRLAVLC